MARARVFLLLFVASMTGAPELHAEAETGPDKTSNVEKSLGTMMGDVYRQLEEAPGRTGILAEKRRYSTYDEELIIRDYFRDRRGGFFVDVGCAWPIKASNTYYLEKHLSWTGIGG